MGLFSPYHLVTTLVALSALGIAPSARLDERAVDAAAGDSLDVLLLATPSVDSLLILLGDTHTVLRASDDGVVRDRRAPAASVVLHGRSIVLRHGDRTRTVDGTVRVTSARGTLSVVARMSLAGYLAGALTAESGERDPEEYRVALAVLQRNYVETHRGRHAPHADLCDNTHCQLFHGDGISARARELVRRALAIELRESDARPCYYSANCGGSTLTPSQVWRRHEAGYASVRCGGCRNSRWHRWRREVPITDVSRRVFADAPTAPFVDDDFKLRAGRVLGFNTLPSNTVDRIERRRTHFVVSGRGFGHRIGLCQDGARDEARRGRRAAEILRRYFPTATVTTSPR